LLLAKRFGVSLYENIPRNLEVSRMGWTIRPFSGSDARGDQLAAIGYHLDRLPASRAQLEANIPEYLGADYTPPPGLGVMRLVVEIDSGSEDARQLAQLPKQARASPQGRIGFLLPRCVR
jgi:hypothetical protein